MALELLRPLSNSATALARCAECEYALGNGISAKEFLRRAVSVNESDPDVLRVGADLRMSDGEYPAAELLLRRLLELQPSHVAAHYRLAECLRLQGRNDEAIRQFKQQEEYRTLRITLSELHLEAIKDPWNADLRDRIADMFQDLGDPEKEAVWRKAAAACRDPQPASASGSSSNKQSAFPQPAGSPEEFPVF